MNVESLRQNQFKVRVIHRRYYKYFDSREFKVVTTPLMSKFELIDYFGPEGDTYYRVNERGGMTSVEITTPDGRLLDGHCECSLDDNYNRKRGVAIALGRAMKGVK